MRSIHRQQGVVLIVGLVMLIMLTLMAVAALKFGQSNFMVVANQQARAEAIRSADQVMELIIQNPEVRLDQSTNIFGTGSNQIGIDINGDGNSDYTVAVAPPTCVGKAVIAQSSLDLSKAADLGCSKSVDQASLGVEGSGSGDSICSKVLWEVTATASDAFQQNNISLMQGLEQRVATNLVATVCD